MLYWIPLLPLLGAALNGFSYLIFQARRTGGAPRKISGVWSGALASSAIFGAFLVSLSGFLRLKGLGEEARVLEENLFSWIHVGALKVDVVLRMDVLSSLFCLVITGVGTLIHLYSIGYMSEDEAPAKFFSYLNLFCFAMLMLVLGGSLPILFLGWEGVGLCSYLLIGFWYTDPEKASAGKKAFIVNRVGDLGFLLATFLLFYLFGTLDFVELRAALAQPGLDLGVLTAISLLLFVGCTGKSAQIPLYVWLPDAMAGPTPVSALIHAATMVTSGIYLIARLNPLFTLTPDALHWVAWIGAITALFAATMAVVQTDIKKVLAYSTVSQLGYMFLGCGVAAYGAGVFHVITHAFFKALLFLGAGSVIHGMHHEQDIMKMGGLKRYMPVTAFVFAVGWLAICGVPGLSGFFSKDEILWMAFASPHGSTGLWLVGMITAIMTAFYMTRLFYLTFLGKPRFETHAKKAHHGHDDHHGHGSGVPHESPWIMVVPLCVLAVASAFGGYMGIPHLSWLDHWLSPVITHGHGLREGVHESMEWILMGVSVAGAALGMFGAFRIYRDPALPARLAKKWSTAHRVLLNKWYVDEIYEAAIVRPIGKISVGIWRYIDVNVIDRLVLSFGSVSLRGSAALRTTQTGSLQRYTLVFVMSVVVLMGIFIYAKLS